MFQSPFDKQMKPNCLVSSQVLRGKNNFDSIEKSSRCGSAATVKISGVSIAVYITVAAGGAFVQTDATW